MRNPYNEVLAALPRRMMRRGTGMWMWIGAVVQLPFAMISSHRQVNLGPFCACIALASVCLWSHVYEQLVSTRRRLVPGYVAPHVAGFVFYASILIAGPFLLAALKGDNLEAVLICELAIFGLVGLTLASASLSLATVNFVAIFSVVFFHPVSDGMRHRLAGEAPWVAVAVAAWALLAAGWALVKMLRLTEEDRGYNPLMGVGQSALRPRMTGAAHTVSASKLDDWLRPVIVMPRGGGTWRRSLAWGRLVRGTAPFGMLIAFVTLGLGYSLFRHVSPSGDFPLVITVMFVYYFPVMVPPLWIAMWRYLEVDSLRPLPREQFLKEHGVAILTSQFVAWLFLATAFAIYMGVSGTSLRVTASLLGGSLAVQVPLFACEVWLLRLRSITATMVFALFAVFLDFALVLPIIDDRLLPGVLPYIVTFWVILIALGVFNARDAWQRWLTTELG